MHHRRLIAIAAIAAAPWAGATAARAATLTVDDDRADCPAAGYASVQAAVDAAATGDTVVICPGRYSEGTGATGTNALTIAKSLTVRGAGADLVTISPKATSLSGSSIAKAAPDVRSGTGDIVAVTGTPSDPVTVDLSGVTIDGEDTGGRAVASEAGLVYLDALGSVKRSRVTNVVTSEGAEAFNRVGGWRNTTLPGYGIVQTSATLVGRPGERRLTIDNVRVDRYNRAGILIDGATGDTAPYTASGVTNKGAISASQVVGRVECANFEANGNCSSVGLLTTGPLFGQDGIRVTTGSRMTVADSLISQNLVNGAGAPTRATYSGGAYTAPTDNNANLALGAGIRLAGASLTSYSGANGQTVYSSATRSNITDNASGVLNLAADGTTTATGNPTSTTTLGNVFKAEDNWWGLGYYRTTNAGPAIAPATNPPFPENPVNGTATADGTGTTSNAVDVFPFRAGSQGDGFNGEYPVVDAPLPISDAAPTVTLTGPASAAPGETVTLTAAPADDIGVKATTVYDGATVVGTVATAPYAVSATIPADAACGSTRSYAAVAQDTLGQTGSGAATVAVTCPATGGGETPGGGGTTPGGGETPAPGTTPLPGAAPAVTLGTVPSTLKGRTTVSFDPSTPAGFGTAVVLLGERRVCTVTAAPYRCAISPVGRDVGKQALRVVVTDARGSTAQATTTVTVPKFASKLTTAVARKTLKGGRVRRGFAVGVVRPSAVSKALACRSGHVTLTIKRGDRTIIDEQIALKGSCVVARAVTATRRGRPFKVIASFSGNAVLRSAKTSRRFN